MSEEEIRNAWADSVAKNHTWATDDTSKGAKLMYRRPSDGELIPVLSNRLDGSQDSVQISYKDIVARQLELDAEYELNRPRTTWASKDSFRVSFAKQEVGKKSSGDRGINQGVSIESSTMANDVDPEWIDATLSFEGATSEYISTTVGANNSVYSEIKKGTNGEEVGFLISMRQSNFKLMNTEANKQKVGETVVYRHKYKGKEYLSYAKLDPASFEKLPKEEKQKWVEGSAASAKITLKAWTKLSTLPEAATFLGNKPITAKQFNGVADIWHVFGAKKLTAGKEEYKQLGILLKNRDFKGAINLIKATGSLAKEMQANTKRWNSLVDNFGGDNV
jgi:hypothetical protein